MKNKTLLVISVIALLILILGLAATSLAQGTPGGYLAASDEPYPAPNPCLVPPDDPYPEPLSCGFLPTIITNIAEFFSIGE